MEKNVITIRQPSTANLLIDSADRDGDFYSNPFDFQITKTNSILNGFFTRIGVEEVVLDWCEPNISNAEDRKNDEIVFDLSGSGANNFAGLESITLPAGHYTVEEALNSIEGYLNDLSGTTGMTFTIQNLANGVYLDSTGGVFKIPDVDQTNAGSSLAVQLGMIIENYTNSLLISCPDLRPYRYIDFVSQQLTYNQDLKDSTTNTLVRDVLCRWYFDDDVPEALDAYGFPILMGYKNFCRRRLFNPPKQIRWSNAQPIGNISFQVYGWIPGVGLTQVPIKSDNLDTDWMMTLQVSEV